jgi:hypothetical protein
MNQSPNTDLNRNINRALRDARSLPIVEIRFGKLREKRGRRPKTRSGLQMSNADPPPPFSLPDLDAMYRDMAKACGDSVKCKMCGRIQKVDAAGCLRHGWPKCCGLTMMLNRERV